MKGEGLGIRGRPLYLVLSLLLMLRAGRQWWGRRQVRRLTGQVATEPSLPTPERPEPVLRAAAARGEARAIRERGDLDGAEHWYGRAAATGDRGPPRTSAAAAIATADDLPGPPRRYGPPDEHPSGARAVVGAEPGRWSGRSPGGGQGGARAVVRAEPGR
ncbi:hypothetical protein ACIRQY_22485 [Streptomyces sp. NPDC101490]|uniref:hypothetical protein n=1 Tax=Streptomyces sp. NPDC101490 TaxID=3366143 RepID=UPI0038015898